MFTVLGFVSLVLVVLIYGSFALGSCFRGCCLNKDRRKRRQQVAAAVQDDGSNDTTTTTEIPFRALVGAEPYLPLLHSPLFPEPFFAFDIATVPPRYLPICNHTNQNNHGQEGQHTHKKKTRTFGGASLCSRRDLPSLPTAAARAAFFATVRYYPLPEAEAAAAAGAVEAASLQPASTTVRVPNPSPVAPGSRMMGVLTPAQLQQPEVAVDLAVSKPLPPGWVVMVRYVWIGCFALY